MSRRRLSLRAALLCVPLGLAVAGSAATAGTAGAAKDWILLTSDRDGATRPYSVASDGSRLTPLLPSDRPLEPAAVSPDRRLIAYGPVEGPAGPIYVSRADGSGLRRLVRKGFFSTFSPNGRLIAFTKGGGIWLIGTSGHGLRRLTARGDDPAWSPDSKALVFMRVIDGKNERYAVIAQPLRGKARVLVRTGPNDDTLDAYQPQWSPNGRWIAYINHELKQRRNGLTLVRPNGKSRHRVVLGADEEDTFEWAPNGRFLVYEDGIELDMIRPNGGWHMLSAHAQALPVWSSDGRMLAFPVFAGDKDRVRSDLAVAGADGRRARRLGLGLSSLSEWSTMWSVDGRVVFAGSFGDDPTQIWVVGPDGRGLRRLTTEGTNDVVGSTPLSPVLPPASPLPTTERVSGATTVVTSTPIAALSADGPRVAFLPRRTATDCVHVMVWAPGEDVLRRLGNLPAPCWGGGPVVTPLVLAGSRAAWVSADTDEDPEGPCSFELMTATLADPNAREVSRAEFAEGSLCTSPDKDHVRGDGDLLVFNQEPSRPSSLVRIGAGSEKCGESLCSTIRADAQAAPVDSVSAGLIATRRPGAVPVLDGQGKLVRAFSFTPADVNGALLDGGRLVVWRFGMLELYDVATGALVLSRQLQAGLRLVDVDGGVAVLRQAETIVLLRLADGHSLTLSPGQGPVLADLDPAGLYYSYATTDGGGRVVFVPRSTLEHKLGAAGR
jgi:Tol biopolymer transport system component